MNVDPQKLVAYAVIAVIPAILVWQSLFRAETLPTAEPKELEPCVGQPIQVDYTFPHPDGTDFDNPWECLVQCDDDVQRYILYSNGNATQCEEPPECRDIGEDSNVQCKPPATATTEETPVVTSREEGAEQEPEEEQEPETEDQQ